MSSSGMNGDLACSSSCEKPFHPHSEQLHFVQSLMSHHPGSVTRSGNSGARHGQGDERFRISGMRFRIGEGDNFAAGMVTMEYLGEVAIGHGLIDVQGDGTQLAVVR